MAENLTEDARVVLAYVRDRPGKTVEEIANGLAIPVDRVSGAVSVLSLLGAVVQHMRVTQVISPTMYMGTAEFYPG